MENKEIRRLNLVLLVAHFKGQAGLGRKLDLAPSILSNIISTSPRQARFRLGDRLARKIEAKLGLENGWLDVRHETFEGLPVLETSQEKTWPFKEQAQELRKMVQEATTQALKDALPQAVKDALEQQRPQPPIYGGDEAKLTKESKAKRDKK